MKNKVLTIGLGFLVCLAMLNMLTITGCRHGSVNDNNSADSLKGTISISGAFALYPMTVKWADEFKKLHPDVRINISAGGAGKGMADALSKIVDIGMVSREVTPEEINKGAWYIALTKDAVLPTICSNNPVWNDLKSKGLTRQKFIDIFIDGKYKTWGDVIGTKSKEKMTVYVRSDACGAAEMWAKYLGKKQENLKGIGVFGDPGIADALKKDKNGIGFNNVNYVFDSRTKNKYQGLEVIPIDVNGNGVIDPEENCYGDISQIINSIRDGRYPSPPARDLYFVAAGKPQNKLVVTFIKWILGEGQKFVTEAGYVQLPDEKIKAELQKLN
ncbi:MAG: extracellular solute-binding protein [Bacteroidia bacterium]|nr:extracellular solute-binding protein [Bacteroidia bacterium]